VVLDGALARRGSAPRLSGGSRARPYSIREAASFSRRVRTAGSLSAEGRTRAPQRIDVSEIGRERSILAFSGVSFFPFSAPRLGMALPHLTLIH
jgi:hypothetical protein